MEGQCCWLRSDNYRQGSHKICSATRGQSSEHPSRQGRCYPDINQGTVAGAVSRTCVSRRDICTLEGLGTALWYLEDCSLLTSEYLQLPHSAGAGENEEQTNEVSVIWIIQNCKKELASCDVVFKLFCVCECLAISLCTYLTGYVFLTSLWKAEQGLCAADSGQKAPCFLILQLPWQPSSESYKPGYFY